MDTHGTEKETLQDRFFSATFVTRDGACIECMLINEKVSTCGMCPGDMNKNKYSLVRITRTVRNGYECVLHVT